MGYTLSESDRAVVATLKKDFANLWAATIELTDGDELKALEVIIKIVRATEPVRSIALRKAKDQSDYEDYQRDVVAEGRT